MDAVFYSHIGWQCHVSFSQTLSLTYSWYSNLQILLVSARNSHANAHTSLATLHSPISLARSLIVLIDTT